jgi:hypothetical protein
VNNEVERVRKRIELWHLLGENVRYSNAQLARKVGASEGFVRKWRHRLQQASGDEMTVFMSQSRRRKTELTPKSACDSSPDIGAFKGEMSKFCSTQLSQALISGCDSSTDSQP